mmetsp:Transcript_47604/g.137509  ORF Transcript_47604/g.137509 Transcript_47604/m.137509 type:complete len:705 (+) Transcript_47604:60-2174(+)
MAGSYRNMLLLLTCSAASVALAAPPTVSVTSVLFPDLDLDRDELGGTVSWTPPGDTSNVIDYEVHMAVDALGGGSTTLGTTSVGTNQISVPLDQALGSYTHLVVMTRNSDGVQTSAPGYALLEDQVAVITGLSFSDKDLDIGHIGGTVAWESRGTAPVSGFKVYTASSPDGQNRVLLGDVTTDQFDIVADTTYATNSYICVYPESSLGQATRPSSVQFYDIESPVRTLAFQDLDLDAGQLGGQVSWLAPLDTSEVTQYVVTRATSSAGAGRAPLGTASTGATSYAMSANTAAGSYTHVIVYSRSSLAEATTPVSVSIVDVAASASGVTFTDTDQDVAELGGTVSWTAPANTADVVSYALYMATSAAGGSRSNGIGAYSLGLSRTLNANTNKASYTHFTVYTRSSFTEQSTPAALAIVDVFTSTTYCSSFTCPAQDFSRGSGTLCTTGVCDAATCCYQGCRGTPSFWTVGFAAAPASCTNMAAGSSCTMQCASGYTLSCGSGGSSCSSTITCSSSGAYFEHQQTECVRWNVGSWGTCSAACGTGTQRRSVECSSSSPGACNGIVAPSASRSCSSTCSWLEGSWSACSEFCGVLGVQTRSVQCSGDDPQRLVTCHGAGTMPATQQTCSVDDCGCFEDGMHDPMRPWGRNHNMSCGTQWWLIFWIIILSVLLGCCCLTVLVFLNLKSSKKKNGQATTAGEANSVVGV